MPPLTWLNDCLTPRENSQVPNEVGAAPPIIAYEGSDGVLVIYNGVTRATRIAKLSPGILVPVEVVGRLRRAYGADPKIGDLLS